MIKERNKGNSRVKNEYKRNDGKNKGKLEYIEDKRMKRRKLK
jgi:hypothetical protein